MRKRLRKVAKMNLLKCRPQSRKATLTIEENRDKEAGPVNKWREIGEAILACDEELPGQPQPILFRTVTETESL